MRGFLLLSIVILLMAFSFFSGQIFHLNRDLDNVYELVLKSEVFNEKIKLHIKELISDQRKVDHEKVETSFNKANNLLNEGLLPEANLYYSKALYDSEWEIRYVDSYVDNMLNLDYCDFVDSNTQHEDDQYLTCLGLFTEIDAFLRSQAVHVSIDDIEILIETLDKISEKHAYVTVQFEEQQLKKQAEHTDNIIEEAKSFIEEGTSEDYPRMLLIRENLTQLDVHAEDNLNRDLSNKIQDILRAEEIKKIEDNAEILVSAWKENPKNKLLRGNYAGLASALINNYLEILLTSERPLEGANELIEELNKPIHEIQDMLLSESVEEIRLETENFAKNIKTIGNDNDFFEVMILKNKADNLYNNLYELLKQRQKDDASIYYFSLETKKKILSSDLNFLRKIMSKYNNDKVNNYNSWAIKKINNLYDNTIEHIKKILPNEKEKIKNNLIEYLKEIDTSLLNLTVMNSYNDVYQHFSSRLEIEDRLEILSKITSHEDKLDINLRTQR